MSRKLKAFLFAILMINTARYATYLIEGNSSTYYIIMLIVHVITLIYLIIYNVNENKKKTTS